MRRFYTRVLGLCLACLPGLAFAQSNQSAFAQQYTICEGETVQLHATGADLYEWLPHDGLDDPYSANPIAKPSVTTVYRVRRLRTSGDLIQNGSFTQGATGFTSQYRDSSNINLEGYYAITANPSQNHIAMNACGDHTSGNGKMMAVNGGSIANQRVWSQVITVTPNTNYAFSTWVNAGISPGSFAVLQFSINNALVGEQFTTRFNPCEWQQFYTVWNSGSSTQATISVVNQNLAREGNDFALDDIFFQSFTVLTDSALVNIKPAAAAPAVAIVGDITPCQGDSVTLQGPAGALGYLWNDGLTTRSRTERASGNFVLRTLGSNGCYSFSSDTAKVDVQPLPNAPVVSLGAGSATSICPGDSALLIATASTSHLWSNGSRNDSLYAKAGGTYTAQAISAQGCISVPSNGITISLRSRPTQPRVTLSGDSVFCTGGSLTITSSYATNNHWSTGATTQAVTVNQAGQYWVYAKSAASCASLKRYINVSVGGQGQRPTVAASGSTTLCPGSSVTLTSSFPSGNTWSNGATSQSITVSAAGNYTVTTTTSCGTSTSLPVAVSVASVANAPTITAPADRALCQGESITLSSSAASGNLWSNGATTQSITVSDAGSYTVQQIVGTCTTAVSQAVVVTVAPKPSRPTITAGGALNFCSGRSVTLTSSASSGNLWSNGATTQSITVNASGSYYVRVQGSSCQSDTSSHVVVNVLPTPAAPTISHGTLTVCEGNTVTLTSSYTGSNAWSTGASGTSISLNTVGTTNVTVRAVSADGCQSPASASVAVTINPAPATPTITPSGSTQLCPGSTVTLTSSANSGNVWSNGSSAGAITVSASGSYTVRTVAQGCSSQVSAPVAVSVVSLARPTISAGGALTFCDGGSVQLTSSASSGNLWSNGSTAGSISVTQSGTYTVQVVAQGCSSTVSTPVVVTVNPTPAIPTITASGPLSFCTGGSVDLTSSASSGNRWSNGFTSGSITVTQSGTYTVRAVAQGCSSAVSTPVVVTVNPLPPAPSLTASGPLSFCIPGSVQLTSSSNSGNVWSNGQTTPSITITQTGSYYVQTVAQGCSSAISQVVAVSANPAPPTPVIDHPGALSFCQGGNTLLISSGTAYNNIWSNGQTGASINPSQSGSYTVVSVSIQGCSSAVSAPVVVDVQAYPPAPVITPSGTQRICQGNSLTLTSNASVATVWSRGDTGQSISVNQAGSYTAQAITSAGCISPVSAAVVLTVEDLPQQPTVLPVGSDSLMSSIIANSYEWHLAGNLLAATTRKIRTVGDGLYTVTALSANNCLGPASQEFNYQASGILGRTLQVLSLAPNPAHDVLTVSGLDGIQHVELRDATGRVVLTAEPGRSSRCVLQLGGLPSGAYSVQARSAQGIAIGRFVKE